MKKIRRTDILNAIKLVTNILLYVASVLMVGYMIRLKYEGLIGTRLEEEIADYLSDTKQLAIFLAALNLIWFSIVKMRSPIRYWIESHAFIAFAAAILLGCLVTYYNYAHVSTVAVLGQLETPLDILLVGEVYLLGLIFLGPNNICNVIFPGANRKALKFIIAIIIIAAGIMIWGRRS